VKPNIIECNKSLLKLLLAEGRTERADLTKLIVINNFD